MIRPRFALYFGGMGARGANFHHDVAVRMGYEAEAARIQDALPGRQEGRGGRRRPHEARRAARADRAARQDPPRPRGVARVERHLAADRRPAGDAAPGRGAGARMSYRFATYEKRGRIAYVTLNRPEVMNALHLEAHLELAEIWEDFRDDPDVWVAILTGAGERAFSAGNDLKVTAERTADGERRPRRRPAAVRPHHARLPLPEADDRRGQRRRRRRRPRAGARVRHHHRRRPCPLRAAGAARRPVRRRRRRPPAGAPAPVQARDGAPADRPHLRRRGGAPDRAGQRGRAARGPDARGGTVGRGDPRVLAALRPAHEGSRARRLGSTASTTRSRAITTGVERLLASADFVEGPKAFAEKRRPQWTGR